MFFLANIVSILDRQILYLLVDPLRHDLGVTDVQISLLEGAAFSICYATLSLPLGLIADRYSRKRLAIAGVLCWSLATIVCGFASDFHTLFLCRIVVGLGEAALSPAAISMICDLAPPAKRGRPLSVLLTGTSLGKGATVLIVGLILALAGSRQFIFAPWVARMAPWREAFMVCGALGFVVAALFLTIREPARHLVAGQSATPWSLKAKFAYVVRHARLLMPFFLCLSVLSIGNYGLAAWSPSLLMRHFGLTALQVGAWLGPALMVAGPFGSLMGGYLCDRASRRGGPPSRVLLVAISSLGFLPGAFAVFAPNAAIAIGLIAISTLSFSLTGAAHTTTNQDLVPAPMRGTAIGLVGFFVTFIGFAGGPLMIALMTEHLFRDPKLVGYSMAAAIAPAVLVASGCAALSWLALRRGSIGSA